MSATTLTSRHAQPIGLWSATAIVIANMIGVGVFTTLSFQVHALPSAFAILVLWALGAVVALAGAFCYAELVAALPRSGGEYHLLGRLYSRPIGFVAGVVSLVAGFAAPIAASAMAFAAYAGKLHPLLRDYPTLLGASAIILLTVLHSASVSFGARTQNLLTAIKVLMILGFIIAGAAIGGHSDVSFMPTKTDMALLIGAPFAVSLVYVNYAYSGWNAAVYMAGETADASRTLPRALMLGTLIVGLLYMGLNAVFLSVVPMSDMLGIDPFGAGDGGLVGAELAVAFLAGRNLFGGLGGALIGALVALGLLSTISAMVMAGPRVAATMAEDYPALRGLIAPPSGGAPIAAIALQSSLALLLLLSARFDQVIAFIGMTLSFCALLVAAGVIKLRRTEPNLARPYRCFGYPLTPVLFVAANGWMIVHTAHAQVQALVASVITLIVGFVAAYFLRSRP